MAKNIIPLSTGSTQRKAAHIRLAFREAYVKTIREFL